MKKWIYIFIMFWNLENFFDPFADTLNANIGEEYTPAGDKHWTWKKYSKKRDLIAKTIISIKDKHGVMPTFIGVCEVENLFVLKDLTQKTLLKSFNYGILHRDSPDKRGIDVALLYKKDEAEILEENYIPPIEYFKSHNFLSRYILHAKAVIKKEPFERCNTFDTIHLFVNHWPSKLGGERQSLHRRMLISNYLKSYTDSIKKAEPSTPIILMGDFNDTPNSLAIENLSNFYNLSRELNEKGSHKYRATWSQIDQYLIDTTSYVLMHNKGNSEDGKNRKPIEMQVYKPSFLVERDKKYLGEKIIRTQVGPRYLGGASDHLPILLFVLALHFATLRSG